MSPLEELGSLIFILGAVAMIAILAISGWELRHGDKKLSRKKFVITIWLIGITSVVSGAGILLMLALSWRTDENIIIDIFSVFFSILGCLVIYPASQIGVYIFHMKSRGYIETDDEDNE